MHLSYTFIYFGKVDLLDTWYCSKIKSAQVFHVLWCQNRSSEVHEALGNVSCRFCDWKSLCVIFASAHTLKRDGCVFDAESLTTGSALPALAHLLLLSCGMIRLLKNVTNMSVSMKNVGKGCASIYLHNKAACCRYNLSLMKENWPKITATLKKN